MQAKIDVASSLQALDLAVRAGDELRVAKFINILAIAAKKAHPSEMDLFARSIPPWSSLRAKPSVAKLIFSANSHLPLWISSPTTATQAVSSFDFDNKVMFDELVLSCKGNEHLLTATAKSCARIGRDDLLERLHEECDLLRIGSGVGLEMYALLQGDDPRGSVRCVSFLSSVGIVFSRDHASKVHPCFAPYASELAQLGVLFHRSQNDSWVALINQYADLSGEHTEMAGALLKVGLERGEFDKPSERELLGVFLDRLDVNQASVLRSFDVNASEPARLGALLSFAAQNGLFRELTQDYVRPSRDYMQYYAQDMRVGDAKMISHLRSLRYGEVSDFWSTPAAKDLTFGLPDFGDLAVFGDRNVSVSALGYACAHGSVRAVRHLVECGFEINSDAGQMSSKGCSGNLRPLSIAAYFARKDVIRELVSMGARTDYEVVVPNAKKKGFEKFSDAIDFAQRGCRRLSSTGDGGESAIKMMRSGAAGEQIADVFDDVVTVSTRSKISGASL